MLFALCITVSYCLTVRELLPVKREQMKRRNGLYAKSYESCFMLRL